jgi:hypothetical protein
MTAIQPIPYQKRPGGQALKWSNHYNFRLKRKPWLRTLIHRAVPDFQWIERLWRHWWKANKQLRKIEAWPQERVSEWWAEPPFVRFKRYLPTLFWDCVRCTVAITLRRYDDRLVDPTVDNDLYVDPDDALAWGNFGTYETDYGTGKSWDELLCRGFSYCIHDNGSL